MTNKFSLYLILLLTQFSCVTPCLAETLFFEDFEDPTSINHYELEIPESTSLTILNEGVCEDSNCLSLKSSSIDEQLIFDIELNWAFEDNIIITYKHYFEERFPYNWVQLVGDTDNSTDFVVAMQYGGGSGSYWQDEHIFQVKDT